MENSEFIKGYENLYKINKNGDIWSCHYKKSMTHLITGDGYKFVNLIKEGERHKGRIHRLLALQYIPNPDNLPEVDHIDRNKLNNSLENLRWVTRVENRRNRSDIIELLTPEQKDERLHKIREYKREWAYNKSRELGKTKREDMTKTRDPEYYKKWQANKNSKMTEEERLKKNEYVKQWRINHPLTEEQRKAACERARRYRERQKSNLTI